MDGEQIEKTSIDMASINGEIGGNTEIPILLNKHEMVNRSNKITDAGEKRPPEPFQSTTSTGASINQRKLVDGAGLSRPLHFIESSVPLQQSNVQRNDSIEMESDGRPEKGTDEMLTKELSRTFRSLKPRRVNEPSTLVPSNQPELVDGDVLSRSPSFIQTSAPLQHVDDPGIVIKSSNRLQKATDEQLSQQIETVVLGKDINVNTAEKADIEQNGSLPEMNISAPATFSQVDACASEPLTSSKRLHDCDMILIAPDGSLLSERDVNEEVNRNEMLIPSSSLLSVDNISETNRSTDKRGSEVTIEEIQVSDEEFDRRLEADSAYPSAAVRERNQKELYDQLKKWNLSILFNALVDGNNDMDSLKVLSDDDFSILTRGNQNLMGPVARLRAKIKSLVEDGEDEVSSPNNVIDIENVLLTDVRGKSIRQFYNQNNQLDKEQRNLLIDVVLDHSINKNEPSTIPTREIELMAEEICSILPTESKAEYFIPKRKNSAPSGPLYHAYNKKIKKYRRQGILPASTTSKNKRRKIEIAEELEAEGDDDILQENIKLVKSYDHSTMDVDIEEVIDLWNEMYEFRTKKLEREERPEIINDWPILKHPEAFRLIVIDFQKKFGDVLKDKPTLQQTWKTFFSKSKVVFADLRNLYCRWILELIEKKFNTDETENEKNVILALALHGLFQPTLRGAGNGEVEKASIRKSQDSFLQLTTPDDFDGAVMERDRVRRVKNFVQHPYIIGISILNQEVRKSAKMRMDNEYIYDIREVESIQVFRVIYGSTIFETVNFLTALDFCFKVYSALKIPYPECQKLWCFLDQAFYGLSNETTSKIVELLKKLK